MRSEPRGMFSALFGESFFVDAPFRGDAVAAIFCPRAFASWHHQTPSATE